MHLRVRQDVLTRVESLCEFILRVEPVQLPMAKTTQPKAPVVPFVSGELLPDASLGMGTPGN